MIDHHHTSGLCTKSDREISKDSATLVVAMSPGRLDWTWPILARTSWCHSQTSGEISSKSIPHNPPANHSLPLGFVGSIVIFPYLISTFFFFADPIINSARSAIIGCHLHSNANLQVTWIHLVKVKSPAVNGATWQLVSFFLGRKIIPQLVVGSWVRWSFF